MENYLVNPVNPMVTLRHPAFTQKSWRSGKTGRFGDLKKRKNPAKRKPMSASVKALLSKIKRRNTMSPLMLLNKRRKSAKRKTKIMVMNPRRKHARKAHRKVSRSLMVINPRRSMRRTHRRSYRRNPMSMKGYTKDMSQLVISGALIVAGAAGGGFLMSKLSAQFPIMQKPMIKILSYVAVGSGAYLLLKKVPKVSDKMAATLAVGFMVPALMDVKDMLLARMGGVIAPAPTAVSYGDEVGAWVPQNTGAYVPEGSLSATGEYAGSY